jgi:tRNA nucleotidyltransferase (CCA-adding enzyme)
MALSPSSEWHGYDPFKVEVYTSSDLVAALRQENVENSLFFGWFGTRLACAIPELRPMADCTQNKYHAYSVWQHALKVVEAIPRTNTTLRLAAFFHDIGKPRTKGKHPKTGEATFYNHEAVGADMTNDILRRLDFPLSTVEDVTHLVKHHLIRYEPKWSASTIRRWVRKVGLRHVEDLVTLAKADIIGKGPAEVALDVQVIDDFYCRILALNLSEQEAKEPVEPLAVNGRDVMSVTGMSPGPALGKLLKALAEVVDGDAEANTRENLLELALGIKAGQVDLG